MSKVENVHIGEAKVGRGEMTLTALLGSCVGVALIWRDREVYGLAHCLLPKHPEKNFDVGGRYVDQAIHSLLKLMKVTPGDVPKIRAVIAGGGNMTKPERANKKRLIGEQNIQSAITTLSELKIKVIHEDTGGLNGRTISIDCHNGDFQVKNIPRPEAA